MVALVAVAFAQEGDEVEGAALYRPPESPAPSRDAAMALAHALFEQVRSDGIDPRWLVASFHPLDLPDRPDLGWYERLAASLAKGALGDHLRASEGVVAAIEGPDYVRLLLAGEPRVSLVIRTGPEGPVIDRIEATTCDLCSEPVRFVRDLVFAVDAGRSAHRRLMPGVDLDVSGWLAANPQQVPHHWLAALEARNHRGGHLAWLLTAAQIVGAEGNVVSLDLADGTHDRWTVEYRLGRWVVDYATLPDDSPLRMSFTEALAWRDDESAAEEGVLQGWSPSWLPTPDGTGVLVGDRAVGAAFDPRDGTLLIGVLDLDRTLAGVLRVDPDQRLTVERLGIDAPGPRTPIAYATWFEMWEMALAPRGRRIAMTTPGRVWDVDVESGATNVIWRAEDVTALGWGRTEDVATLMIGTSSGEVAVLAPETRWADVGAAPLLLDLDGTTILAVTADGRVVAVPVEGPVTEVRACPGNAADAARDPDGTGILVTCADGDVLAARVPWPPETPRAIPGAPTARGGASFSPDGLWFTTGAAGDGDPLLLWDARAERPVATLGVDAVRAVTWSPDGSHLATVEADGRVWLWSLEAVRRARGL